MIQMMSNKGFKIAAKSENISNIKVLLENPFHLHKNQTARFDGKGTVDRRVHLIWRDPLIQMKFVELWGSNFEIWNQI